MAKLKEQEAKIILKLIQAKAREGKNLHETLKILIEEDLIVDVLDKKSLKIIQNLLSFADFELADKMKNYNILSNNLEVKLLQNTQSNLANTISNILEIKELKNKYEKDRIKSIFLPSFFIFIVPLALLLIQPFLNEAFYKVLGYANAELKDLDYQVLYFWIYDIDSLIIVNLIFYSTFAIIALYIYYIYNYDIKKYMIYFKNKAYDIAPTQLKLISIFFEVGYTEDDTYKILYDNYFPKPFRILFDKIKSTKQIAKSMLNYNYPRDLVNYILVYETSKTLFFSQNRDNLKSIISYSSEISQIKLDAFNLKVKNFLIFLAFLTLAFIVLSIFLAFFQAYLMLSISSNISSISGV